MKLVTILTLLAALCAALFTVRATADQERHETRSGPALERLKELCGTWVALDDEGEPTDEVISKMKVTAGGSAILEVLFPDTDHEMVTVYHQEGDELVLTHYCVLGNQPKMRRVPADNGTSFEFECIAGSNTATEQEDHMHQGRLQRLGKDRMKSEWLRFKGGEHVSTAAFNLQRIEH